VRPLGARYDGKGYIKCLMALRGVQAPAWTSEPPWRRQRGWPADEPAWLVSAEDVSSAVDDLVNWALAIPGRDDNVAVSTGAGFTPVTVDGVLPLMRAAAANASSATRTCIVVRAASRFRSVDLTPGYGFSTACDGDIENDRFDWQQSLTDCARLLEQPFQWCGYGHLTRGAIEGGINAHMGVFHGSLRFDADWVDNALLPRFVPASDLLFDIYGHMRLPGAVAGALNLPGAWDRVDQGNQVVLSDRNTAAWFANTSIDPIRLEDCREAAASQLAPRRPGSELRVSDQTVPASDTGT
jgi:hypothetical protein